MDGGNNASAERLALLIDLERCTGCKSCEAACKTEHRLGPGEYRNKVMLGLARVLPCSVELKRVLVVQAAMPAGVFPIVLSRLYGGDPATAVRIVAGTTLLSLVTIPLWIRWGLSWLDLNP